METKLENTETFYSLYRETTGETLTFEEKKYVDPPCSFTAISESGLS